MMNINPKHGTEKNTRTPIVKKMLPALLSTTLIVGSLVAGGYSASANGLPLGKTDVTQSLESSMKHGSPDTHSGGLKATQAISTGTETAVSADVKISEQPWLMAKFHSFIGLFTLLVNKVVTTEIEAEKKVTADADTTYSEQKSETTTEKVEKENKAQTKQTSGSIKLQNEASANIQTGTTKQSEYYKRRLKIRRT
ncbi:hypothetical protein H1D32_02530 [Anaerobacillus sp. CMMVII]|uniref:hypothetical protein n=1 Tax=Anaerobacillus sp. CMMVII TaxID=2755588 RepID=UPI0021B70FCF|nr:hypothetical protein [Anaerobacillus sp. CMMVII]MCT8136724.1 hypothetical protein [Anaerobacillus sp. CMMVII]